MLLLLEEEGRHQESGKGEEHVNPHVSSAEQTESAVVQQDRYNSDRSYSLQIRAKAAQGTLSCSCRVAR